MGDKEKSHRNPKTTRQQFCMYLEELEKNKALQSPDGQVPDIVEESWSGLCNKLNSSGGPRKTMSEWKKVFTGWKYSVRKKARQLIVRQNQTGGGPPDKPLTDIEQKFITLTGQAAVTGIAGVEEMGLQTSSTENTGDGSDCIQVLNTEETNKCVADSVVKRKAVEDITTPVSKKKRTLTTRLQSYLEQQNNPEATTLVSIATALNKLVKIEKKKVMIEEVKLKLKYDQLEFNLNVSSDED